jgi:hypothetical protein
MLFKFSAMESMNKDVKKGVAGWMQKMLFRYPNRFYGKDGLADSTALAEFFEEYAGIYVEPENKEFVRETAREILEQFKG